MFTTPCFIRKNTPELWKALEDLGYEPSRVFLRDSHLCIATAVNAEYAKYTAISKEMFDTKDPHATWNCAGRIDCGTNEELFIATAALRDDSDYMQFFRITNLTTGIIESECVRLRHHKRAGKIAFHLHTNHDYTIQKLSPQELIEHFNHE